MWQWFRPRLAGADKDERGFTLVELLVVMIIVGILAGVGVSGYQRFQERAYVTAADSAWRDLQMAISLHEAEDGAFPRWKVDDGDVDGTGAVAAIADQLIPPPEPLTEDLWVGAATHNIPATDSDGILTEGDTGFVVAQTADGADFTCVWVNGHPSRFNNADDQDSPCVRTSGSG